jgi:hypothetical protein
MTSSVRTVGWCGWAGWFLRPARVQSIDTRPRNIDDSRRRRSRQRATVCTTPVARPRPHLGAEASAGACDDTAAGIL